MKTISARHLLFYLIMLSIPLVVLEGLVRIIHWKVYPLYEDKAALYTDHEVFHHWHVPSGSGTIRALSGEFEVDVSTNEYGMAYRQIPVEKPSGSARIAVLGDSFVEGFTTEEPDRIVNLLQDRIDEHTDRPIEVLNFGCGTFSPSLEYMLLENLVARFEPDAVVLLFHATDVTDDWVYVQSAVRDPEGDIVAIDGTSEKSGLYRLAERSAALRTIVQQLRVLLRERHREEATDLTGSLAAMFKETYEEGDIAAWDNTKGFLSEIKQWTDARGVPFVLSVIPLGQQVEVMDPDTRYTGTVISSGEMTESEKMQETLREWSVPNGVTLLDLLPAMKTFKSANPGEPLFYPRDQHFNPLGNRVAADAIFAFLSEQGILGALEESPQPEP